MSEDIYGPSILHLKGKKVRHKNQHLEPIKITSFPNTILDKYNEVIICCDLMHINGIGFLNTISWHMMFDTGSMIKNIKVENIADGITQVQIYTCSLASRSHICTLTASSNRYVGK